MSNLRVTRADLFDAEIRAHNERFRAVAAINRDDRVLDIGCGTGESTRHAAQVAADGSVLGVDISADALALARRISAAEGLTNVAYEQADAQTHPFPPDEFDVCISRFGVMFFADLVAAFTNIGLALRADARLVLLVWQQQERNEWSVAVRETIGSRQSLAAGLDPFALGDPPVVEAVLGRAGFVDVSFIDVHEPVSYGPDVATATEMVLGLRGTEDLLAALDRPAREHAVARLRALIAAHQTDSGVLFDSRAWIITARLAGRARRTETSMDYARLTKKLTLPDGAVAPRRLVYDDLVATAISRSDLGDDVRGINASVALIQQTRGGTWPTGPVSEDYDFVDLVWHELEFREGSSFSYVVRDAVGAYLGCCYLYPMGGRTPLRAELIAYDVDVSWWVTPDAYTAGYYTTLYEGLRHWLATEFPFWRPYYSNLEIPSIE